MKTITKLIISVALCTAVACATIAASGSDAVVIKMGTVISNRDGVFPHHMLRVEQHMQRLIEKYTNGEVILEVLESGTVPVRGMLDMVTSGEEIQAANINAFFFPKVPEMLIQSIPFLFTGAEHARRFANSEPAEWMSDKIESAYDVKVLGYLLVATDVSFNSVEPVRMPSDFTGKIVNGSRGTDSMFDGVKPKSIEHIGFGAAMSGGLVDSDIEISAGMIQNNDVQQLYKRFKYTTLVPNYYTVFYTPVLNRAVWDSLSESQQRGIDAAMREAENAAIAYQHDTLIWAYQLAQSKGVKMRVQTDAERAAWKAEFYPPIKDLAISSSDDPAVTRAMIQKIEDLVTDLVWR
jgi:TRAP-type C4-dicarboxylate transport system substrate-binding protein